MHRTEKLFYLKFACVTQFFEEHLLELEGILKNRVEKHLS